MTMRIVGLLACGLTLSFGGIVPAQETAADTKAIVESSWHQWRGPEADGTSTTADPPTTWSETEHVKWKVPIDGMGSSSPIVWGDKIFLLTAISTDKPGTTSPAAGGGRRGGGGAPANLYQFVVLCLDRETGKELWRQVAIEQQPHESGHATNTFASASAITDGKRLFAFFGSRGLFCYDLDGKKIWDVDLGDQQTRNAFGEGGSPALSGDTLVVPWDHEGQSFLAALDAATGKTIWRKDRDEPTTWATPLIVERAEGNQVVAHGTNRVRCYDLKTGDLIWECGGQASNPIPCPVRFEESVIAMTGYRGYEIFAIPLSAKGDITGTDKILWHNSGDAAPYVSSPVLYKGQLYFVKGRSPVMSSVNAKTGDIVIGETRLPGTQDYYASPVAAQDRIYFTSREGTTLVLKHGPKFEILATNRLDEPVDASPALVGKQMFLRGAKHLYCLEN